MAHIILWKPLHWMSNLVLLFFVPTSHEGAARSGNTHYKSIWDMFCGSTNKIKLFKECYNKYEMSDVLMIPTLVDSSATHLKNILGGTETRICLINHLLNLHLNTLHIFRRTHKAIILLICSEASGFKIYVYLF